jgi:integrase/recombinase XerD
MNFEPDVFKNKHFYRENPFFENHTIQEIDASPPKPSSESAYITELLKRLLANDSKKALIEKTLFRFFSGNLFGSNYVERFMMELYRHNCRKNTIRGYSSTLYYFIRFLKERGHSQIKTVTREDLGAYVESQQDQGLKPRTVRTRINQVSTFLKFLADQSVISSDVLKKRMRVKIPESLPRAIDPKDIQKLLPMIKKPRDHAIVLLLLRTGMRIGELLSLKMADIDLKDKKIDIVEAQKNRVGRVVYYSKDASRALNKWLRHRDPDQEYIFYGQRGNPRSYETVRTMFMDSLKQAGLSDKGYTLHCLRHTFASELLNAGMRLECLQQLLGHTSIEVTRIYARLTDVRRKEEYFTAMSIIEKGGINGHYRCDN